MRIVKRVGKDFSEASCANFFSGGTGVAEHADILIHFSLTFDTLFGVDW